MMTLNYFLVLVQVTNSYFPKYHLSFIGINKTLRKLGDV